ncbi:MAG: ABC transporter ATP-binding protein [Deltaproteobacteria bacterium]|nr:ABC transporter ATP-binding protein [Deltaproteobacteria bacterium]
MSSSADSTSNSEPAGAAPRGARVTATQLTRRFGNYLAVDHIDLDIQPGETLGLLGANGAGKTTFIRLVTGYLLPTSGELSIDGYSPVTHPQEVHRRLGYATETSRIYPELPVESFLRFIGGSRGMRGDELGDAVLRVMARFELEEVFRRPMGHLSKGYQQRVSLAQAFLSDPPLLIVDEPTSGLDPYQQAEVREVLQETKDDRTILLCTHDLSEARALSSRVAILRRGKLVALGPTEEVLGDGDSLDLFHETEEEFAGGPA